MSRYIDPRAAMERLLAERAETLLRQRSAQTGLRPRTLLNQVVPIEATRPKPGEAQKNAVVRTLLQRLKERDDAA